MLKYRKWVGEFMQLGKVIGKGNTAEIYELNNEDNKILKLFYERMPYEYIEKEYEISIIIKQLGVPSPNVEKILKLDNKWGIIYEKINGQNFTHIVSSQPLLLNKNAQLFSELQVSFHRKSAENLPSQKEYFSRNISVTNLLSNKEKEEILNYLVQLPNDNKVCHGDYHTDNVFLIDDNLMVLDWMTGTSGNPCADVARTLIIIRYSYLSNEMPKTTKLLLQIVRNAFARIYLNSYLKLTNDSIESINKWILPVMAARLVENIPDSEKQLLLKKIKSNLKTI